MRPKQALIKKADPKARISKYRVKQDKLYQNWRFWTIGESYTFIAFYSSLRKIRLDYKRLNDHRLLTHHVYFISLIKAYQIDNLAESFTPVHLAVWAIPRGLLTKSYKYKKHYTAYFIRPMLGRHLINEVGKGRYALSNRSKHIWGQFERYMREYFENDLLQPSRTSQPTKPVD